MLIYVEDDRAEDTIQMLLDQILELRQKITSLDRDLKLAHQLLDKKSARKTRKSK